MKWQLSRLVHSPIGVLFVLTALAFNPFTIDDTFGDNGLKYTSKLNFFFTHSCQTASKPSLRTVNKTIEIQLFEALNGERTGEKWPDAADEVYLLEGHSLFKNTKSISIRCAPSTLVCYGATVRGRDKYWGLGGVGDESCTNCCASCPRAGWQEFRVELRC